MSRKKDRKSSRQPIQNEAEPTRRANTNEVNVEFAGEVFTYRLNVENRIAVLQTSVFQDWFAGIGDVETQQVIDYHVNKIRRGLFGNWKEVDGVYEVKIDIGPGYRIYYAKHGNVIVVLLGGGDKKSQRHDIDAARTLWKDYKYEIKQV